MHIIGLLGTACRFKESWCSPAGTRLLFGGEELQGHRIPKQYGAMQATAVFVPLR